MFTTRCHRAHCTTMMLMFVYYIITSLCLLDVVPLTLADDAEKPQIARCLVDFARSDVDKNQQIDRQEFNNLILERDCQFILENDVAAMVFRYMACSCQSYDNDTTCCDNDDPVLYRPDSDKKYPANYLLDVCAKLDEYCDRQDSATNSTNHDANATSIVPGITPPNPSTINNSTLPNNDTAEEIQPTVSNTANNDETTNSNSGWIWGVVLVSVLAGMISGYMMLYKWSSVRTFLHIQNHSQSTTIAKGNFHGNALCINECTPRTQDEDSMDESGREVSLNTTADEENAAGFMAHDTSTDNAAADASSCEEESQGSSSYQTGSMGLVKSQHQRHTDRIISTAKSSANNTLDGGGSPPIIEWAMYPVPSSPQKSTPRSP